MSAHTQGPWTIRDRRNVWAGELLIVKAHRQGDEGEANARLIAAAPRMLDLVKMIVETEGHAPLVTVNEARAILREIEGECQ